MNLLNALRTQVCANRLANHRLHGALSALPPAELQAPRTGFFPSLLATLGFARSGTHIAKALSLWTQGEIRIDINRETGGLASSAFNMHGTTVCDIGLSVADAADAVARATHLGASPFGQPLGPGELDIPAIRGLSGSVLHFIDAAGGPSDVWSVEFKPTGQDDPGAGLKRVDHLAQTMSYDEMLSWSSFYTTLFRMRKSPMVDVVDPDGLVRSQALETEDGGFRITLNGAETHRTMAGNFLADSFGASVQHVALATDDIQLSSEAVTVTAGAVTSEVTWYGVARLHSAAPAAVRRGPGYCQEPMSASLPSPPAWPSAPRLKTSISPFTPGLTYW